MTWRRIEEIEEKEKIKIMDITADKGNVVFIAKVTSIGDIWEYPLNYGPKGHAVNLVLKDDTGMIRTSLWDEACHLVKIGHIKVGQILKVKGHPRHVYNEPEIIIDVVNGGGALK